MRESYVSANGIRLHYLEAGPEQGERLVLLHGFPEYSGAWREQIELLAADGYHVIAPDQRGYNLSDKPSGIAAYNVDQLAADVIALLDGFRCEKALLAGHDWGGIVAW